MKLFCIHEVFCAFLVCAFAQNARIWQPAGLGNGMASERQHSDHVYLPPAHILEELNKDRNGLERVLRGLGLTYRKEVGNVCEFSMYVHCVKNSNGYHFNASGAGISGNVIKIWSDFELLNNVQSVDLSHNELEGSVPHVFWKLNKLKELRLNNNRFDSIWNTEIDEASQVAPIRLFDVSDNKIKGEVPRHWMRAKFVDARNNNLYGVFPDTSRYSSVSVDLSGNLVERPDLSSWFGRCGNTTVRRVDLDRGRQMSSSHSRVENTIDNSNSLLGFAGGGDDLNANLAGAENVCMCENCRPFLSIEQAHFSTDSCEMNFAARCSCVPGFTITPSWSSESSSLSGCRPCPRGLDCAGGAVPSVTATGFITLNGVVQQCPIPSACSGNDRCVENSVGSHCAGCTRGTFLNPLVGEEGQMPCQLCSSSALTSLLIYVLVFGMFIVFWYRATNQPSELFQVILQTLQAISVISVLREAPQRDGYFQYFIWSPPAVGCLMGSSLGPLIVSAAMPFFGLGVAAVFCARHLSSGTLQLYPTPKFTRTANKVLKTGALAAAQCWCYSTAPHTVFALFRMVDCSSGNIMVQNDKIEMNYFAYRNQFGKQGLYHDSVLRAAPSVACWSSDHFQLLPVFLMSFLYLGICLFVATFNWKESKFSILSPARILIVAISVSFGQSDWPFVLVSSLGVIIYLSQPQKSEFHSSLAIGSVSLLALLDRLWWGGLSVFFSGVYFSIPILIFEALVMLMLRSSGDAIVNNMFEFFSFRTKKKGILVSTEEAEFIMNDTPRRNTDDVQLSIVSESEEREVPDGEEGRCSKPSPLEVAEKNLKMMTKNAQEMRDERDSLVRVVHKLRMQVKEMSKQQVMNDDVASETFTESSNKKIAPAQPPPRRAETARELPAPSLPEGPVLRLRSATINVI